MQMRPHRTALAIRIVLLMQLVGCVGIDLSSKDNLHKVVVERVCHVVAGFSMECNNPPPMQCYHVKAKSIRVAGETRVFGESVPFDFKIDRDAAEILVDRYICTNNSHSVEFPGVCKERLIGEAEISFDVVKKSSGEICVAKHVNGVKWRYYLTVESISACKSGAGNIFSEDNQKGKNP